MMRDETPEPRLRHAYLGNVGFIVLAALGSLGPA
jgi:hypothetical protein